MGAGVVGRVGGGSVRGKSIPTKSVGNVGGADPSELGNALSPGYPSRIAYKKIQSI